MLYYLTVDLIKLFDCRFDCRFVGSVLAHQAPPSMGFSRQYYWSGLPFPSPGDLPNPGIEPRSPALQDSEPLGKPKQAQVGIFKCGGEREHWLEGTPKTNLVSFLRNVIYEHGVQYCGRVEGRNLESRVREECGLSLPHPPAPNLADCAVGPWRADAPLWAPPE